MIKRDVEVQVRDKTEDAQSAKQRQNIKDRT